jgi:hypothetical protein
MGKGKFAWISLLSPVGETGGKSKKRKVTQWRACYGGKGITRARPPGVVAFLVLVISRHVLAEKLCLYGYPETMSCLPFSFGVLAASSFLFSATPIDAHS